MGNEFSLRNVDLVHTACPTWLQRTITATFRLALNDDSLFLEEINRIRAKYVTCCFKIVFIAFPQSSTIENLFRINNKIRTCGTNKINAILFIRVVVSLNLYVGIDIYIFFVIIPLIFSVHILMAEPVCDKV